ncbi:hypothetical protein PATSB16_36380 [Pandoraea thiooxydans]|nr:hypothetical protein PATSB16_36380 [Pandoraea thiooxydans]
MGSLAIGLPLGQPSFSISVGVAARGGNRRGCDGWGWQ